MKPLSNETIEHVKDAVDALTGRLQGTAFILHTAQIHYQRPGGASLVLVPKISSP